MEPLFSLSYLFHSFQNTLRLAENYYSIIQDITFFSNSHHFKYSDNFSFFYILAKKSSKSQHSWGPLQGYRTTLTTMVLFPYLQPFIERVPPYGYARSSAVSLSPVTHHRYPALLFFIVIRFHWLEEFVTRDKIINTLNMLQ
jgi:hypothetical protein